MKDVKRRGLGETLFFDAIKTVASGQIGAHAIFVDASDDQTAVFHAAFGFIPLAERPRTLYLPVANALGLIMP